MDNISVQFDKLVSKAIQKIDTDMFIQLDAYGENMVDNIIPLQRGFKNLTGNTITSFAYGIYINKELKQIGLYHGEKAIRSKLVKGEIFTGDDYDGKVRRSMNWDYDMRKSIGGEVRPTFMADVDTDGGYGKDTSIKFLEGYVPNSKYAIVFTTGTEYSEFLETRRNVNVLTDAKTTSISNFIQSFKPIN